MKRLRSPWLALPILALMLVAPITATGDDLSAPSDVEGSSWVKKAIAYVSCGASIVVASTGTGVVLAILACGNAINEWFTE